MPSPSPYRFEATIGGQTLLVEETAGGETITHGLVTPDAVAAMLRAIDDGREQCVAARRQLAASRRELLRARAEIDQVRRTAVRDWIEGEFRRRLREDQAVMTAAAEALLVGRDRGDAMRQCLRVAVATAVLTIAGIDPRVDLGRADED